MSSTELGQSDCDRKKKSRLSYAPWFHLMGLLTMLCGWLPMSIKPVEIEPTDGQLRIFWVHYDWLGGQAAPATTTQVNGCIFAFADINGMVAVGVNSSVPSDAQVIPSTYSRLEGHVFRIVVTSDLSTPPQFALHQVAEWNHNFFLSSLGFAG